MEVRDRIGQGPRVVCEVKVGVGCRIMDVITLRKVWRIMDVITLRRVWMRILRISDPPSSLFGTVWGPENYRFRAKSLWFMALEPIN